MSIRKIRLEEFVALLEQNTSLTEVLECLEERSISVNELPKSNVIPFDRERRLRKAINLK